MVRNDRRLPRRPKLLFTTVGLFTLVVLFATPALAQGIQEPRPFQGYHGARLSPALEQMLRDHLARGGELSPEVIRRWGLDLPLAAHVHLPGGPLAVSGAAATVALLPDVLINDPSGDVSCQVCLDRPLGQAETTIATLNGNLLAGWNDTKGFCDPSEAVQGYGYSIDNGATWTDGGSVPALPTGGRYRGDPVHAVNRKTGDFYIAGIYEGGGLGWGLAVARGHFDGPSFVFDHNIQPWVGGSDFLDKEWMEVDSLSGNVYLSTSNFVGGATSQIELKRSTDNGVSWSGAMILSSIASAGLVQGSRPVVGPDGELYVVWYEEGSPKSRMVIRRSDDFGASFAPEVTVAEFFENSFSGAPGYRRFFGPILPGVAVDRSSGPHRGRVYVTWAESVNYSDAPFSLVSPISEVESNDFFASATPFTVGDVLRGSMSSQSDVDLYRFSGLQGQTFVVSGDSATTGTSLDMRLVCDQDTTDIINYRFLAYTRATLPTLVFTLPADGEYFLRINTVDNTFGDYRLLTAFDVPSGDDRARDHRDVFLAYSDDGSSWSTPVRLNDDDPWYDSMFPEVTVDSVGNVHAYWHDWRGDPVCGAESFEYMVSSGDGGVSWGPNQRVSDELTYWSINTCGGANQGDYQGVTSEGKTVYLCWSDPRLGDPDVYMDAPRFSHVPSCPSPVIGSSAADPVLSFFLSNDGNVERELSWSIEDDNGWLIGATPSASGSSIIGDGGSLEIQATFSLPSDCSPDTTDNIRFITADPEIPGRIDTCLTSITCSPTVDAPGDLVAAISLGPARPNPTSGTANLSFSLSRRGPAQLAIYNAVGAHVRTLVDGVSEAGPHQVVWNGLDSAGRRVPSEVYYVRLEAEGQVLRRTLILVR